MKCRRISTALLSAAGVFFLIIDGKTAIAGIAEGIRVCTRSVIPSLFPFFVLGSLLTGAILGCRIPVLQSLGQLFQIPKGAESLLLIGFLGGYPVGAQTISRAYQNGQLSKQAAERMLVFCNQPGPSFLFGILGPILSARKAALLWGIQMISALLVSLSIPAIPEQTVIQPREPINLPTALNQGIRILANVCGWITLFRMIIAFAERWLLWMLPTVWKVGIIGIMELANGCLALQHITNEPTQLLICSGILSFGGLCVTMQTASVADQLRLRLYFPGKLLQAAYSMLLTWVLFPSNILMPVILVFLIPLFVFSLRKMENRSRNRIPLGV